MSNEQIAFLPVGPVSRWLIDGTGLSVETDTRSCVLGARTLTPSENSVSHMEPNSLLSRRKLHAGHFAFMRAVVSAGVDAGCCVAGDYRAFEHFVLFNIQTVVIVGASCSGGDR